MIMRSLLKCGAGSFPKSRFYKDTIKGILNRSEKCKAIGGQYVEKELNFRSLTRLDHEEGKNLLASVCLFEHFCLLAILICYLNNTLDLIIFFFG